MSITDEDIQALLRDHGDPAQFFAPSEGHGVLIGKAGQISALLIEDETLAAATEAFLRRVGQIRSVVRSECEVKEIE